MTVPILMPPEGRSKLVKKNDACTFRRRISFSVKLTDVKKKKGKRVYIHVCLIY